MSRTTSKIAVLMVGLLAAAGVASPARAAEPPSAAVPAATIPALPELSYEGILPILGGEDSGDAKCTLLAFSLGPLYFLGPFGPLGPWGPMGPLHGDPDHPCFGGLKEQ